MTLPNWLDMHVVSNAALTAVVALVGHGMRKIYKAVVEFLDRVDHHEEDLDVGLTMVDTHSKAMLKAGLLKPPIRSVHRRRYTDKDREALLIVVEDDAKLSS